MKSRITLIIFWVFISGCSARHDSPTPVEPLHSPSPIVTSFPAPGIITNSPTPVNTPRTVVATPTTMPVEQYVILSPLAIKKDNIIIEVTSYTISSSTFRFGIRITGLSPSQIPELPPEYTFSPIIELKFLYGDQGIPLELEPYGGGGGGGTNDDGTITISQDFSYKLVSPLPTGQKQHIIALVTLDNIFGIAEPIRFDLEIVPEEGIQG